VKDLEHVAVRAHPDFFQFKACEFELREGRCNCDLQLHWQVPYHTIQLEHCKRKREAVKDAADGEVEL